MCAFIAPLAPITVVTRLFQLAVHQFLGELRALELQELEVFLEAAVQRHRDLPRPREDVRVLHRGFVIGASGPIGVSRSTTLSASV
jgi:hypothetical protein